jgi:Family of unknown function (DUF6223)
MMKRTFVLLLAALAAVAVFAGLVYVVLVATHLSESAATTVQGPTTRRLWATTASVLALISVVMGGLAMVRSASFGAAARIGVILALAAGLVAVINGALVLVVATGGLGSGNGVVGGAVALVLGLIGMIIGGLALSRSRRRTVAEHEPICCE